MRRGDIGTRGFDVFCGWRKMPESQGWGVEEAGRGVESGGIHSLASREK